MKNCDFKQVMKVFIVCFVLLKFGSVETAAIVDCPPQQVLHFNPETNKGICCIPVPLPKGFGFKSCTRNGTHDTIEVCPTMLYQWDDTTTATEATCTAEMPCLDVENLMIEKCDDHGRNCRKECVCNFPGGFCGTEYFNCNPFPVGCLRNNVQEDCSCRSPGLEPDEKIGKSDPDLPNPVTPITSVSRLPSSPASGKSDKKIEGVPTADVGNMNETGKNNNDTKSQTKPEESLSIGFSIGLTFAVIAVIGGLIFVYILRKDRYKRLWGKCKRENKNNVTVPDETAEQEIMTQPFLSEAFRPNSSEDQTEAALSLQRLAFRPNSSEDQTEAALSLQRLAFRQNSSEDQTEAALSLQRPGRVSSPSEYDVYRRMYFAQSRPIQKVPPFRQNSSEDQTEAALSLERPALRQEVNGAQSNLLEDPHFLTLGSSLFDSHSTNSTADQQEVSFGSGRDETHVNEIITSENRFEEEGHDSDALENLHFPTLGSSLFDSRCTNSTADQQEVSYRSGRDQTHVKEIITSENHIEEEGHDSGALENSRLCHVALERDGEEEEQLL